MFRELDSTALCILLRTSLDRAQKISYRHLAPWTTFASPSPQNVDGYYLVSSHARLSNHGQLISTANTFIAVWSTNRVSILLARSKVCSVCTGTSQYAWASCNSQNGLGSNREYQGGTELASLRSLSITAPLDLTVIQNFLDRCHKRRFISFPVFIKNLLNKQDQNILKKLISTDCHPLKDIIPVQKTYVHNLRKKGCVRPKINTERFMNTFVNRLIFKLHLL